MASEPVGRVKEIRGPTRSAAQWASLQLRAAFYAELRVAARYLDNNRGHKARKTQVKHACITPDKLV